MFNHNLDYIKLIGDFEDSFYQLEYAAIDRHFKDNSISVSDNVVNLLNEELKKIDQYFNDLFINLKDENVVGSSFYDFYHRYFSHEISDKLIDDIKNDTSNVEKALVMYTEEGYKVVPHRYLSEELRAKKRECNVWGEDCTFPIIINKELSAHISGQTLSLVNLSSLKFYDSEEEYVGDVLRNDLNEEVIGIKKNETKSYYVKMFKSMATSVGRNWENEIDTVLTNTQPKIYGLEKH